MIVQLMYPDRPVLTEQHSGQCANCKALIWRVLLDRRYPTDNRRWIGVERSAPHILHPCEVPVDVIA